MATASIDFNNPYQYSKLTSRDSTRLIKIVPELIHDEHIGCIVYQYTNSKDYVGKVEYRALSYLWGDPAPSRRIGLLDGTILGAKWHMYPIHSNLWLFLAHMWRKEQFECLLWTDSLCLNQCDEEEMAQQIPRMGLIYSQAESVIIWLGLSAWEEHYFQEHLGLAKSGPEEWLVFGTQYPPQRRLAIFSVLDHDYWKRMWIMQEVVMAQKVVVEMQEIPPVDFAEMGEAFSNQGLIIRDGGAHMLNLFRLRAKEGGTMWWSSSSWILLRDHCQRRCTRPQDRIYGLLGMVKDDDPIRQITVNYEKPVSDVLFDVLFTVSGPWLQTRQILCVMKTLMSVGLLEDVDSLEGYSKRDHAWKFTEDEIVRRFARISLRVFDALNLIMATFGGLTMSHRSDEAVERLVEQIASLDRPASGVDKFQWKAVLGIVLAFGLEGFCERINEQWKKFRWPKLKAESFWLCAEHSRPTPLHRPFAPKQLHLAESVPLKESEYRPNEIFKTCAQYGQSGLLCEGYKMSLDVPESHTRLELDYTDQRRREVILNIWFQIGASGIA